MKVLIIGANNIGHGGRSTVAYNISKHIGKDIICDFVNECKKEFPKRVISEIDAKKGKIINANLCIRPYVYRQYLWMRFIKKVVEKNSYEIVHIHCDNLQEAFRTIIWVKLFSDSKIVVHGHASNFMCNITLWRRLSANMLRKVLPQYIDACVACSEESWRFVFGEGNNKKQHIVSNGIEVEKYKFNPEKRELIRNQLNINNMIVFGNVANFYQPKNHFRLIDIFAECRKVFFNCALVLIGEGELKDTIQKYIDKQGLDSCIFLLGHISEVSAYYSAMDIFLMPSVHEGVPLAGIEAQYSCLPCFFSTGVSQKVKIIDSTEFISLELTNNEWARFIYEHTDLNTNRNVQEEIINSEYNILNSSKAMRAIYQNITQ